MVLAGLPMLDQSADPGTERIQARCTVLQNALAAPDFLTRAMTSVRLYTQNLEQTRLKTGRGKAEGLVGVCVWGGGSNSGLSPTALTPPGTHSCSESEICT